MGTQTAPPPVQATKVLPPFTAVRLAWAIAGRFASSPESKLSAQVAEQTLKDLSAQAATDARELAYVSQVQATIQASVRSIEIIYRGRELNFQENEKLREAYMENVRESVKFGDKAKDYLKALPTMALAGPGAAATLGPVLAKWWVPQHTTLFLWAFGAAMAGLGFLIHRVAVSWARKRTQKLYVQQDYERNLYYHHYIERVRAALTGLYQDIDRIHRQMFTAPYPNDGQPADKSVADLLQGVAPTMCDMVYDHMRKGKVTPALWVLCEVGRKTECPNAGK